jgi:hypothetical protein
MVFLANFTLIRFQTPLKNPLPVGSFSKRTHLQTRSANDISIFKYIGYAENHLKKTVGSFRRNIGGPSELPV